MKYYYTDREPQVPFNFIKSTFTHVDEAFGRPRRHLLLQVHDRWNARVWSYPRSYRAARRRQVHETGQSRLQQESR